MSTALYRRYRPDRFEEVIGQDHVTVPLRTALAKDRVNHAYLFSGPRGCGKTTSARILARCLNCAKGPTPTPCGECDSCRDLATGGPGSLDVLEIDAASHGGVDDARGLRERATFAPVRDRYKIMIIDEAHMVTAAGFNALLKIVEEPPEHLKFVFATTEPEKVIGTIRSRTHHYPFRLVPPEPLIAYLEQLCGEEGVRVEPGVLPLVVRAGTGSVRDTLSVLDQLIAGAQEGSVSYDLAVSLLGFTPEALLDDVIDAVAADDTPTVFRVVDRVVQSGQDPRRFVEDLLDRFRDLVIARALPEEAGAILHGMPDDQVRRLSAQAAQLSRAELSRLADVTNLALSDMVGATSPRLHLELLMARLVLPSTDDSHRGLAARLEALERRLEFGGVPAAEPGAGDGAASPAPSAASARPGSGHDDGAPLSGAALARAAMRRAEADAPEGAPAGTSVEAGAGKPVATTAAGAGAQEPVGGAAARTEVPEQSGLPGRTAGPARPEQADGASRPEPHPRSDSRGEAPEQPAPPSSSAGTPGATPHANPVEMVRRAWPDILAALEDSSRLVWMLVKDNATVAGYDGSLLTIGFHQDGPRQSLLSRGGDRVLAEAVHRALGIRPELDLILGGDAPRPEQRPKTEDRERPESRQRPGEQADAAPRTRPRDQRQPDPRPPHQTPSAPRSLPAPDGGHPAAAQPQGAERPRTPVATSWDTPAPAAPQPRSVAQPPSGDAARVERRPSGTTPESAPATDGWGHPGEQPPPWDDAPPPPEDPWESLPEFDPDSDMEDSPGPEGWTAPAGVDTEDEPTSGSPASWGGPVPSPDDWGTPARSRQGDAQDGARAEGQGAPAPRADGSGAGDRPSAGPSSGASAGEAEGPEDMRRAYDPGPLVREPEMSIPVFARPEAELRAEFEARFGATRPSGFDAGTRGGAPSAGAGSQDAAASPSAPASTDERQEADGVPPGQGDDPAATEREDPHPAAAASATSSAEHPVSSESPSGPDAPAPGVPEEDHDAGPGRAGGFRGSGHPASRFPQLMERLEAGGPLEPPVNQGTRSPDGATGRPSPAALGARPDGPSADQDERPAQAPPAMDPRAAAIRAAREAAQGRGPAWSPEPAPSEPEPGTWSEDVASEDDVALEDSGLVGRAVVERVLGARLLEERPHDTMG